MVVRSVSQEYSPPAVFDSSDKKTTQPYPCARAALTLTCVRLTLSMTGCFGARPWAQRGKTGLLLSNPSIIMQSKSRRCRDSSRLCQYTERHFHVNCKCPRSSSAAAAWPMKQVLCLIFDFNLSLTSLADTVFRKRTKLQTRFPKSCGFVEDSLGCWHTVVCKAKGLVQQKKLSPVSRWELTPGQLRRVRSHGSSSWACKTIVQKFFQQFFTSLLLSQFHGIRQQPQRQSKCCFNIMILRELILAETNLDCWQETLWAWFR